MAVVIDVLRASSTIVTALANGCRRIIPVVHVREAFEVAASLNGEPVLLCGERKGNKVSGFDLGNSPREYAEEVVRNKTLILTTTNGTRAIHTARRAHEVLVGSFLNVEAVADWIRGRSRDVVIFCAGGMGQFSLEDAVCAGFLVRALLNDSDSRFEATSAARSASELAEKHGDDLRHMLFTSKHGRYLTDEGFGHDLEFCARLNSRPLVPVLEKYGLFSEFLPDKSLI